VLETVYIFSESKRNWNSRKYVDHSQHSFAYTWSNFVLFLLNLFILGSVKPGDNTNIYIPQGIWLVVDYPLPRILLLRIDGVLEFEQVQILRIFLIFVIQLVLFFRV
jgi:hypothetical protein